MPTKCFLVKGLKTDEDATRSNIHLMKNKTKQNPEVQFEVRKTKIHYRKLFVFCIGNMVYKVRTGY